jgi:hypothetical protein
MSKPPTDAQPRRPRGRPKGSRNHITQDLREMGRMALEKLGGRDYLVDVGRKRPDVFMTFIGRLVPAETKVTFSQTYQAMPIPVESRDALPAPEPRTEVLEAVYDAIQGAHAVPDPVPTASDDAEWL